MPDPSTYRPAPGTIPDTPGVYRFRDEHGRVIYVGKAKSLRQRLSSYFADLAGLHPRTQTMLTTAASLDWTVVATEVEALQLEYSWIKEFEPRFNVRYRDDKSYPFLAVTLAEEFPRLQVMRGAKRKGTRYFGPYAHAWAIRDTLDLLLRVFPARTCSTGVFRRAARSGRPCLLGDIGKCSAPCVGRVSAQEHRGIVEDFCDFMAGQTGTYLRRLERSMRQAAAALDFERAARLRDDIKALERAIERNAVVLGDGTDADVVGLAEDVLEAAVQVFHVRDGRVRGQRGWVVEKVEEVSTPELLERFLQQLYGDRDGSWSDSVPRQVLLPQPPADLQAVQAWLSGLRGSRVSVRVPQRGDKRSLLQTVTRNAEQSLTLHKARRSGDLSSRSAALAQIQDALGLPEAPLRIECFDISHLQGEHVVASMVVFEDGLARRADYRRFQVRGDFGHDDTAAMREVLSRRFRRQTGEPAPDQTPAEPGRGGGSRGRFAYPPGLVVVDGGRPQVGAASAALRDLGVTGVAVVGLAKRLEELWLAGQEHPVVLPRTSEGLYLLQRVRDEAHRFAITYHRQRRGRAATRSTLEDVPGLGPARQAALRRHFGSISRARQASLDELAEVPGVGPTMAGRIAAVLRADTCETPAVDLGTGEILAEAPCGPDGGVTSSEPDRTESS